MDAVCKTLLICGSPGVGKSLLATDLARQLLPGGVTLTDSTPGSQAFSKARAASCFTLFYHKQCELQR